MRSDTQDIGCFAFTKSDRMRTDDSHAGEGCENRSQWISDYILGHGADLEIQTCNITAHVSVMKDFLGDRMTKEDN